MAARLVRWSATGRLAPTLTAQSPREATILVAVTRGHLGRPAGTAGPAASGDARTNLVAYRTTDGGQQWQASIIRLPAG